MPTYRARSLIFNPIFHAFEVKNMLIVAIEFNYFFPIINNEFLVANDTLCVVRVFFKIVYRIFVRFIFQKEVNDGELRSCLTKSFLVLLIFWPFDLWSKYRYQTSKNYAKTAQNRKNNPIENASNIHLGSNHFKYWHK